MWSGTQDCRRGCNEVKQWYILIIYPSRPAVSISPIAYSVDGMLSAPCWMYFITNHHIETRACHFLSDIPSQAAMLFRLCLAFSHTQKVWSIGQAFRSARYVVLCVNSISYGRFLHQTNFFSLPFIPRPGCFRIQESCSTLGSSCFPSASLF